jgi:hypothetical protein
MASLVNTSELSTPLGNLLSSGNLNLDGNARIHIRTTINHHNKSYQDIDFNGSWKLALTECDNGLNRIIVLIKAQDGGPTYILINGSCSESLISG